MDAARQLLATMRRIDRVRIDTSDRAPRCSLEGVGHRLPTRRAVSLRTALGLRRLGVPVTMSHR